MSPSTVLLTFLECSYDRVSSRCRGVINTLVMLCWAIYYFALRLLAMVASMGFLGYFDLWIRCVIAIPSGSPKLNTWWSVSTSAMLISCASIDFCNCFTEFLIIWDHRSSVRVGCSSATIGLVRALRNQSPCDSLWIDSWRLDRYVLVCVILYRAPDSIRPVILLTQ